MSFTLPPVWRLHTCRDSWRIVSDRPRCEQTDLELVAIARRNVEMEFEALRLIRRGAL